MKLYKFYKNPSDDVLENARDLSIQDKYPLYAFTNDKKLAKKFMQTRNMKKFIKRVSDIDKNEYVEFANNNRGQMLETYAYDRFVSYTSDPSERRMEKIQILTTWEEREMTSVSADDGVNDLTEYVNYNFLPFIFQKKYLNALDTLEFITHWKYLGVPEKYSEFITPDENEKYMDFSSPNISVDEFALYILLYGDTYNE